MKTGFLLGTKLGVCGNSGGLLVKNWFLFGMLRGFFLQIPAFNCTLFLILSPIFS